MVSLYVIFFLGWFIGGYVAAGYWLAHHLEVNPKIDSFQLANTVELHIVAGLWSLWVVHRDQLKGFGWKNPLEVL